MTKGVSGIVVYAAGDADQQPRTVYPCIKCSRCVEVCPMHLNPSMLGQLAQKREYGRMEQEHHQPVLRVWLLRLRVPIQYSVDAVFPYRQGDQPRNPAVAV